MVLGTIYSCILLFKKVFKKSKYPDSINIVIYYRKEGKSEIKKKSSRIKEKIKEKRALGNKFKPRNKNYQ